MKFQKWCKIEQKISNNQHIKNSFLVSTTSDMVKQKSHPVLFDIFDQVQFLISCDALSTPGVRTCILIQFLE